MKKIHFIAIGGAAMHNLAIALKTKGYEVTGSDDEIFEPSRSRLLSHGLLPDKFGWYPEKLQKGDMDIILGMHARPDNPELLQAQAMGLKIYSYPEYLYEQTQHKKRVVIAGSHGKTTITAMVIHVLTFLKYRFDFMVGSQIDGFDNMVSLADDTEIAVFEGDEYLSSPLDLRPKFIHYKPFIALITGIAWDHINVFPTFETYVKQFENLVASVEKNGHLIFFRDDEILAGVCSKARKDIHALAYFEHPYAKQGDQWNLITDTNENIAIEVFGRHNLQNINGAKAVCGALGITDDEFYSAIARFRGTRKRLQILQQQNDFVCYLDFAHSPSKVRATVQAVKEKHGEKCLVAILELHSFSSLNKAFIPQYRGSLDRADEALVYYDREVLKRKGMDDFESQFLLDSFQKKGLRIINEKDELAEYLESFNKKNKILLLMSSGNFSGIDLKCLRD